MAKTKTEKPMTKDERLFLRMMALERLNHKATGVYTYTQDGDDAAKRVLEAE